MYANLKFQIWKSGLRQNRLAQMVGIDQTLLSKVINGYREPSSELRQRIASALECDEVWLFEPGKPAAVLQRSENGPNI